MASASFAACSGQVEAPTISPGVVAGQQRVEDARERAFVPATPIILALCLKAQGRRDKPGDDARI